MRRMNQITNSIDLLAQFIFFGGVVALGFGLILRGIAKPQSDTLVRGGLYAAGGSLVLIFLAGTR